ncbi:MAG: hypothetical protein HY738_21865, partial [Bacteroidia bacterium]|nr:hypothetical protein [Bacteroidia bacterium]
MKKILIINFVLVSVLTISYSYSQCAYDNVIYLTWTAPATVGASQTTACIYGGEYNRVTGMVAGYTYRIQTCGDTDFDTQITIYPAGGGGVAGFNDDGCSLQSTIDFTPIVGGDYDILVDEWDCISNSICMTLSIQLVSTPGCPTVGFYRYPDHVSLTSVSPFTCDQEFWITAFDSIDAGGYDKPGWSVVINPTDANSTTQNSIEFFADGVSIGGWAPTDIFSPDFYGGTIDNNMIMTFYADGFDPNVFWSFEWCDNGPSGTFPYLVYDHANLSTPVTTGTFDHNGGTNCFSVNIGYLNGIADFTGPGIVYDIGDGWAYFDAAAAGPGTHTITYCWDNENGCSDCASQTITVNGPTASAGPAKAVCQGSSVAIGGSPTATGGVAGYTYQWSPSTGLSNTTIANPTATPNSTTTYTVTVTDAGGSGCTATSSVTVTVYSKPTASVSPDPAATCAGVGFQLNGNPTPGSGVITGHSWTGNTSPLSSTAIVNPIFNTSTAGIYNLTYTVTDNNGCTGSDNISVTVYQNPASAITPDPATVCAGSNLTLFGNPSGGTGIYTHSWTGGGAIYLNNVNISTPVFNCSTAGTYNLTYTVTDSYGCQSTDVITVTVNSKPAAGITPDPASVCAGANLTLNGNPSGGVSPYSHLWTGTSTMYLSSTSIASPVFSSPVATTYNYTYTVTDANGCTFSDNITVSVNAAPSANILPDPAVPCSGTNLFLNGNPSGSSGVYVSHLWTGDTGPLSSNNVVNPTFNSVSQGTYNLTYTVTDNLGCTGTDNISVTVTTTSDASFSYTSSTFCQSGVDPTPNVVTPGGTFSSS